MSDGFPDTVPAQPWPVQPPLSPLVRAAQAPMPTIGDPVHTQPFRPFVGVATPLQTGAAAAPVPGQTVVFNPQATLATQGADVAVLRAQLDEMRAEVDEHRTYIAKAFENVNELALAMEKLAARTQAVGAVAAKHIATLATLPVLLNGLRADIDGLALIQRAGRRPV